MKRSIVFVVGLLVGLGLLLGCSKSGDEAPESISRGRVKPAEFAIVDDQGRAFLTDAQIADYDWASHTITLRPGAEFDVRPDDEGRLVPGIPFEVVADGAACYKGVVTTSFSSYSQSCPVIDVQPSDGEKGTVTIQLGYPGRESFEGDDPRGDERIRMCLLALGKLRERESPE